MKLIPTISMSFPRRRESSPQSNVILGLEPRIHHHHHHISVPTALRWIPACAGMTKLYSFFTILFLLFLAACTPTEQPVNPSNDAPRVAGDVFYPADCDKLPLRTWRPKSLPRAIIIAVHGFNDYSNAFTTTGQYFRRHNVAVYAYDQRGFGASPETGIWGGIDNYIGDLKQFVELVKARDPGVPVYLLGESMGGAVLLAALSTPGFPTVSGAILSAPAVWGGGTLNPFYRSALWVAAHTVPDMEVTGRNLHIQASNNIPMLRRLVADPLVQKKTRIDSIYGMVALMDVAYDNTPQIHTPLLFLYGGKDQVIPKKPIEKTVAHFSESITYIYYPDGYHMLLRDLQGESVMADILNWIRHTR